MLDAINQIRIFDPIVMLEYLDERFTSLRKETDRKRTAENYRIVKSKGTCVRKVC